VTGLHASSFTILWLQVVAAALYAFSGKKAPRELHLCFNIESSLQACQYPAAGALLEGDGCGLRSRCDVSQFLFSHQFKLPGGNFCSYKLPLRRRFCSRFGPPHQLVAAPHAYRATL
jgi:hypothetical protein